MKKLLKRLVPMILCLSMLLGSMSLHAGATDVVSGKCGKNVKWSVNNKTETLTISGKGAMSNYPEGEYPWEDEALECYFTKVVVKKGVTSIGSDAFFGAELKQLSLPSSLTKIGARAFAYVEGMSSITVPKRVKSIGTGAFWGAKIRKFKVAKGSKYFSVKSGVLYNRKKTALICYPARKKGASYTIPSSVKTIKAFAFAGDEGLAGANPYLSKLVVPAKVRKIESYAFYCSNITTFQFKGKAPKFGSYVFDFVDATVRYPKKYKSSWKSVRKKFPNSEENDIYLTFKAV